MITCTWRGCTQPATVAHRTQTGGGPTYRATERAACGAHDQQVWAVLARDGPVTTRQLAPRPRNADTLF